MLVANERGPIIIWINNRNAQVGKEMHNLKPMYVRHKGQQSALKIEIPILLFPTIFFGVSHLHRSHLSR